MCPLQSIYKPLGGYYYYYYSLFSFMLLLFVFVNIEYTVSDETLVVYARIWLIITKMLLSVPLRLSLGIYLIIKANNVI
jgi:hypothetical protein